LAGRGEIDLEGVADVGCVEAVANDFVGFGDEVEAAAVDGGELQAEEEGLGALAIDEVAGQRVDDLGESELDGGAVFQGREGDDVAALHERAVAGHGSAVEGVAFVEAGVEVAVAFVGHGDGAALHAVGLDVAAEVEVHWCLLGGGSPPYCLTQNIESTWVTACLVRKYLILRRLRVNI
jgi:hypothetical protein